MKQVQIHESNVYSFLNNIFQEETEEQDDDIAVIPMPCGTGKSAFISRKIQEIADSNGPDGLIVVTDSIERMENYLKPYDQAQERAYYNNRKRIALLTNDNISDEIKKQRYKPVLILTTQRYFRLSRAEIKELIPWDKGRRTRIFFDEKPYFYQLVKITIKDFTDVDAALQMAIDDEADQTEKAWCVEQWELLKDRVQIQMDDYEKRQDSDHLDLYHVDGMKRLTSDDDRFFQFIRSQYARLNANDANTINSIEAIKQIIYDGAMFTCRKKRSGEYEKHFMVGFSNYHKMIELGAKVIIFDGSADINPEYDCFKNTMYDCDDFKRPLDLLTINCINVSTSKNALSRKSNTETAVEYIKSHYRKTNLVVFTYKEIERKFANIAISTGHFGKIKGINEWRNEHHFVQFGLNRFPPMFYFLLSALIEEENCEPSIDMMIPFSLPPEKQVSAWSKMLNPNVSNGVMDFCLLSDIEQNIYRSAIRNADNTQPVTYDIFLNTNEYADLIDLLRWRFGKQGAKVNLVDTPHEFLIEKVRTRNGKKPTHAQTILQWISEQKEGTVFKKRELLNGTGISNKQFDKVIEKSPSIKAMFNTMKSGKQGYYIIQ